MTDFQQLSIDDFNPSETAFASLPSAEHDAKVRAALKGEFTMTITYDPDYVHNAEIDELLLTPNSNENDDDVK